jgi:hypothetical protein
MSQETHLPISSLNRSMPRDNASRPDMASLPLRSRRFFGVARATSGMTPSAGPVNRGAIAKRRGEVKKALGWRDVTRRKF